MAITYTTRLTRLILTYLLTHLLAQRMREYADRQQLITLVELPADVRWTSRQNVRHKNAFVLFASDNVEAKPRRTLLQRYQSHVTTATQQADSGRLLNKRQILNFSRAD